ncbi:MAG TPA: hypothetical protein VGG33_10050, partial [Polyangia bacterium]
MSTSLVLSFGDLVGRFDVRPLPPALRDGFSGGFLPQVHSRYAPFLLPTDAPATLAASLDFVATPAADDRERQMQETPLVVSTTASAITHCPIGGSAGGISNRFAVPPTACWP